MQSKFSVLLLFFALLAVGQSSYADSGSCPTELIKSLSGTWSGDAVLTLPSGETQRSGTRDIFAIRDCSTFEVTVNYLDGAGNISRVLHFFALADSSQGLFKLVNGTITEGSGVTPMTGTIQVPELGILHGSFSGAVGGKAAWLSEVMQVNGNQLTRTIRMTAGNQNGAYIGTRVVHDSKVQQ